MSGRFQESDAEAINLSLTAEAISEIVDNAKGNQTKVICFVTGVPGAGKTLAGLNIANERLRTDQDEHAVFLSGNGPLVKVLREALTRDELSRLPNPHTGMTRKLVLSKVEAFIQNIHHFRDDAIDSNAPPVEKVVVFDEAQRAWTLEQTESFMKRKRRIEHFGMSEPQFLISVMDRHSDWAVIVCLVGGGQEINTGEAGLIEWLDAVKTNFPNWEVWCAHNLLDDEYTRGQKISELIGSTKLQFDSRLHLAISLRSFRSENVSGLVKALLDNDCEKAIDLLQAIGESYPIVITRDLATARHWLKTKSRGTERFGLLASSGAIRLRPIGINVKSEIDVVDWFLNKKSDIRSSYFLEEVASEFDIQGSEPDWTCVIWDADLRYIQDKWDFKLFRGTDWYNVNDSARMRYLKNSYRVLLTRARQGMVIVVPQEGSDEDQTRKPEFYDGTYYYLRKIGFEVIQPINELKFRVASVRCETPQCPISSLSQASSAQPSGSPSPSLPPTGDHPAATNTPDTNCGTAFGVLRCSEWHAVSAGCSSISVPRSPDPPKSHSARCSSALR